jgi:hemerythrin superfamily protein
MSWLDKIGSTVFPLASDEKRAGARREAEQLARDHQWLAQIVAHHKAIEQCFADALAATDVDTRRRAMQELARLNTGHSIAEEVTVYPALIEYNGALGGKVQAALAYEEQQMAKIQQAMLEKLDPMSAEWRAKLDHIKSAVQQHVYEEESNRFADLAKAIPAAESARLSRRYAEEFERYCGEEMRDEPAMPLQMAAQESGSRNPGT